MGRGEKFEMLISHRVEGGNYVLMRSRLAKSPGKRDTRPDLRTRRVSRLSLSSSHLPSPLVLAMRSCTRTPAHIYCCATWSGRADHNVTALLMTKHRAHRIGGAPVRGSPPLVRSSASRRCRCCGGGYNTAASLYAIVCDADCHYFAISASRPPRIAFAVRPSGNIWTYWNTSIVSIYVPFCPPPSALYRSISLASYFSFRVSLF